MAKISELPRATSLSEDDLFPVVTILDNIMENKTISVADLALVIITLQQLVNADTVDEMIQQALQSNEYVTLNDLIIELSRKADVLHSHSEYSEVSHTHDYGNITNAPDFSQYVSMSQLNEVNQDVQNLGVQAQTNALNILALAQTVENLQTDVENLRLQVSQLVAQLTQQ